MDTESKQSEKLNSAVAEAPVAVDTAVPSAGLAEPSAGSTFRCGEELEDLVAALDERIAVRADSVCSHSGEPTLSARASADEAEKEGGCSNE